MLLLPSLGGNPQRTGLATSATKFSYRQFQLRKPFRSKGQHWQRDCKVDGAEPTILALAFLELDLVEWGWDACSWGKLTAWVIGLLNGHRHNASARASTSAEKHAHIDDTDRCTHLIIGFFDGFLNRLMALVLSDVDRWGYVTPTRVRLCRLWKC